MPDLDLVNPHAGLIISHLNMLKSIGENMKIVCQLNDILLARDMSNRELARQAGISPNMVGNLIRTHYSSMPIVHLKTLSKVCVALDIAPGDLLKLEENT